MLKFMEFNSKFCKHDKDENSKSFTVVFGHLEHFDVLFVTMKENHKCGNMKWGMYSQLTKLIKDSIRSLEGLATMWIKVSKE